jgi:tensin
LIKTFFYLFKAVNLLKTKPPGTFLIRDSQGFPGSYGLAVKVETLPPGIHSKPGMSINSIETSN